MEYPGAPTRFWAFGAEGHARNMVSTCGSCYAQALLGWPASLPHLAVSLKWQQMVKLETSALLPAAELLSEAPTGLSLQWEPWFQIGAGGPWEESQGTPGISRAGEGHSAILSHPRNPAPNNSTGAAFTDSSLIHNNKPWHRRYKPG